MLDSEIEKAINDQLNAEIYSSYLYYSMAAWFESQSLKGFSHWLRIQALEELTHVQRFYDYVHDRGGRILMQPIDGPRTEWDSPLGCFEDVYAHEVEVTRKMNALLDLAMARSDHATTNFLQWFIAEQVEEEASADEVVQRLKLVEKTEGGLFLLDQEMDKRTFVPPPDLAGVF
jgi:ferritin